MTHSNSKLEELIGRPFNDERLLQRAFVHRSVLAERPELAPNGHNERLEFLGDALLNFVTANWLYERLPNAKEGVLTARRAALVQTSTLAGFARELGFGPHIKISKGEDNQAARNRDGLLADVFEAVLGAILLDQGFDAAQAFVLPFLERQLAALERDGESGDFRSRLQELIQGKEQKTPRYQELERSGSGHEPLFTMQVLVGDRVLGSGSGPSKQAAAQEAARVALERLGAGGDAAAAAMGGPTSSPRA